MGLVSGRVLLVIIAIVLTVGWAIGSGSGLITWGGQKYECFGGRSWQAVGDKLVWLHMGKLELKYQPMSWDCDKDHQYDPKLYVIQDGQLTARSATPTN